MAMAAILELSTADMNFPRSIPLESDSNLVAACFLAV